MCGWLDGMVESCPAASQIMNETAAAEWQAAAAANHVHLQSQAPLPVCVSVLPMFVDISITYNPLDIMDYENAAEGDGH